MIEFSLHSVETAPGPSKSLLEAAHRAYGFVPNLQKVFAESPALLEGYMKLWVIAEKSSLSVVELQVVYLVSNFENECEYCMAGHTGLAKIAGVPGEVVEAIREDTEIADPRLEALRRFTSKLVTSRGWMDEDDVNAFIAAGYTRASILDVNLAVVVKVMSNYTNHIAHTPLDSVMQTNSWMHPSRRNAAAD